MPASVQTYRITPTKYIPGSQVYSPKIAAKPYKEACICRRGLRGPALNETLDDGRITEDSEEALSPVSHRVMVFIGELTSG